MLSRRWLAFSTAGGACKVDHSLIAATLDYDHTESFYLLFLLDLSVRMGARRDHGAEARPLARNARKKPRTVDEWPACDPSTSLKKTRSPPPSHLPPPPHSIPYQNALSRSQKRIHSIIGGLRGTGLTDVTIPPFYAAKPPTGVPNPFGHLDARNHPTSRWARVL